MIRDTEWRAERRRDSELDMYVELYEEAFRLIFQEWVSNKLEYFSGQYIFADLNAQHIFDQLQTSDILPEYSDGAPIRALSLLEQATYRTDPDRRLYERYYLPFCKAYKKENEVTWEAGEYMRWYIEKLAEELTYHYLHLILNREGYEPETYLTAHPKPIDTYISPLTPTESTPEGKEDLKSAVRLVGRFDTRTTSNNEKGE